MHRLGIWVNPEHSTQERDFAYMELAAKYGFSRIFTCLLSASSDPMVIKREFGAFLNKAHELGFEVAAEISYIGKIVIPGADRLHMRRS